jgi:Superfamily I DNA and RNA helicases
VELCIVGDDDQSIYQWRGSDVANILEFAARYPDVAQFTIAVNRRSRPSIIRAANKFSATILNRLHKQMKEHRDTAKHEMVVWRAETEADEAETIAANVLRLRKLGYRYRDVAVLVRGATSYKKLLRAFGRHGIPVQPGGRTGLFLEPDAQLFGRTFAYLAEHDWRETQYGRGQAVTLSGLVDGYDGCSN